MSKKDFNLPAMTSLVGSHYPNLKKVIENREVSPSLKNRLPRTKLVSLIAQPFTWLENKTYNQKIDELKIDKAPVFILGHWRSGTTHLHNIMSQDKQFAYVDTYHGVFPNILFSGSAIFKNFMKVAMPKKRATDNVELGVNYPQEEEFAIGNMCPHSFYNFWYFPNDAIEYYKKYLMFEGISETEFEEWKTTYQKLVKKAVLNTGGQRFISKNPPHTSRVKELLEIYPDAKFIFLTRNPYTVFESTRKFFRGTLEGISLQEISDEKLENNILEVYKGVHEKYEAEKHLIPSGNLIELRFEDFEEDNFGNLEKIYKELGLEGYNEALPNFKAYIGEKKGYKKNAYNYAPETIEKVEKHWGFALDRWNYRLQK
ncbi:sulfotransferase family protein [Sediminitomix flava]|uniref:Sulfotransferase family protein n=1 Tax=Sediminitomix flava TaxID=379075 RepID=A0A315Z8Y1_SEDFL|nr:sulfotransferase [Sediminitomix flava]PWJ40160.1 sulfotransferase family protein [Sediminitomix flava]